MPKTIFYGCGAESIVRSVCDQLSPLGGGRVLSTKEWVAEGGGIAFSDQDAALWGSEYFGLPVIPPSEIQNLQYDRIVATAFGAESVFRDLTKTLGICAEKIIIDPARQLHIKRRQFLYTFAAMAKKRGLRGDVAEGGVYKGDFAREINAAFPKSTLYLFDTFEGFDDRDARGDATYVKTGRSLSHLANTSVQMVMDKLPHPEKAIIKKGYFPESAVDVDSEFVFVCLDFDLYRPILSGLEFFYPKMIRGGVILIHDYFTDGFFDTNKAVDDFCLAHNLYPLPIGDVLSVVVVKQ